MLLLVDPATTVEPGVESQDSLLMPAVTMPELVCVAVACALCASAFVLEKSVKREFASTFAAVGFMACSGCLLLVNKIAVFHVQMPTTVVFVQLVFTAVVIGGAGKTGVIDAPAASRTTVWAFAPVAAAFLATVVLSSKILQFCNVEAMIVVRAMALVLVAFLDLFFFGKKLTTQGVVALVLLCLTSGVHASYERDGIQLTASWWILAWYAVFCFDQIYIKAVITKVKLPTWSNVFYTNALSSLFVVPLVVTEFSVTDMRTVDKSTPAMLVLAGSCFLGLCMSYFSFSARAAFSATYFTLLGNVCKLMTIVLNNLVWTHHSSRQGTFACILALICAYLYQENPKPPIARGTAKGAPETPDPETGVKQSLLEGEASKRPTKKEAFEA